MATHTINVVIDGGGSVIPAGKALDVMIDFGCTIKSVTMLADVSGSVVVDIRKSTYAAAPPTVSITAAAKPTLASAVKSRDVTLAGWDTAIAAGSILRFNVESATAIRRVLVALKVTTT